MQLLLLEMAGDSAEETWKRSDYSGQEEEEEEALSLCDLPVNLIKEDTESSNKEEARATNDEISQEDFDFGPWGGSVSTKSEMCAADDIFFQGQILPLRLSVSSESGVNKLMKQDSSLIPSRCLSRSESLDHNSIGGFTSFSSRSSSSRSSHYSSSSSTSSSVAITSTRISRPRIQNHYFHTHPSPKPQIRLSSASLSSNAGSNRNRNSSIWDFLRLGLVRTPEIELQDLKVRNSVSRNSSSSSTSNSIKIISKSNSNGSSTGKIDSCPTGQNMEKQRKQSLLEKGGGLLSGCSCSVNSVKPVPLNILVIKSSNSSTENGNNDKRENRGSIEEKLQELKLNKKRMVQKQQQGKQAMSRHRTFEWIKELSHASYLDHEEEA